jgi:tetratricopeptide (TPR) repeat protein
MSWVDVEAFEEAAANARRLGEPAAYRAAIEMHADDLLPQDRYEEWAEERREGLRRDLLALLVELARLHEGRGELEPAIEVLRRVVGEEQTHEVAHAGLMRMYAIAGRRDEALKQYERLREALSRDLDTAPDAESRLLREGILAGKRPTARPSRVEERWERSRPQHNLPAQRASFVGREHELVEVGRLLSMTRLLTLTGAGGSGKTRLALEVARGLVGAYPDGVWFVELAGLSEGRWSRRRSPRRWEYTSSPLGRSPARS